VIQWPCLEEGVSSNAFSHKEEDLSSSYIAREQQNAYIRHPFSWVFQFKGVWRRKASLKSLSLEGDRNI